jgi:hypothetical protein
MKTFNGLIWDVYFEPSQTFSERLSTDARLQKLGANVMITIFDNITDTRLRIVFRQKLAIKKTALSGFISITSISCKYVLYRFLPKFYCDHNFDSWS